MRISANENVSSTVIRDLRGKGHDVFSTKESMAGSSDEAILARAQMEDRVVVTHDKDFGVQCITRNETPAKLVGSCFQAFG